jgi:hypothetical protein
MAFSFGRQFRRIAAEALTADPDEMRALIARLLLPRADGTAPVLRLETEADYKIAPVVIVAAFFAYALSGDEAVDLLRQTEDPRFRKQALQDPADAYAMWGPISLDSDWRDRAGLPRLDTAPTIDFPPWGPPLSDTAGPDTAPAAGELVNNNKNTSAPAGDDAAVAPPERPP